MKMTLVQAFHTKFKPNSTMIKISSQGWTQANCCCHIEHHQYAIITNITTNLIQNILSAT